MGTIFMSKIECSTQNPLIFRHQNLSKMPEKDMLVKNIKFGPVCTALGNKDIIT